MAENDEKIKSNLVIDRRRFLQVTSAALLATQIPGCQLKNGRKPNMVLIFADDLGYGDLGCYGNQEIKSPNIDRLASEGIRFTDFYVTGPACTPSRSGLLTGRYPQRNGLCDMIRNDRVNYGFRFSELEYAHSEEMNLGLDLREVTIAQALKKAGYTTGIVGKWDSGRAWRFLPLQRGFDFFYGFANTGIDYWTHERYGIPSMFRGNELVKEQGYATHLFKREALKFIEDNKDRPFFLYVPFNAPHGASNLENTGPQAPEEYIRIYGEPPGDNRMRYKANVSCLDAAVAAILRKLKDLGMEENTLVIFTSDNGGYTGNNMPLRDGKGTTYEGGIRVPFIAKWPGQIPEGRVSHEFCSTLDLFPAFLDVAGAKPFNSIKLDGFNILPVLTAQGKSQRKDHFWEYQGRRGARVGHLKWVAQRARYELLPEGYTGELYDLENDMSEQRDLTTIKPELCREMKARWESWMQEMANTEPRGPFSKYYFEVLGFFPSNKY